MSEDALREISQLSVANQWFSRKQIPTIKRLISQLPKEDGFEELRMFLEKLLQAYTDKQNRRVTEHTHWLDDETIDKHQELTRLVEDASNNFPLKGKKFLFHRFLFTIKVKELEIEVYTQTSLTEQIDINKLTHLAFTKIDNYRYNILKTLKKIKVVFIADKKITDVEKTTSSGNTGGFVLNKHFFKKAVLFIHIDVKIKGVAGKRITKNYFEDSGNFSRLVAKVKNTFLHEALHLYHSPKLLTNRRKNSIFERIKKREEEWFKTLQEEKFTAEIKKTLGIDEETVNNFREMTTKVLANISSNIAHCCERIVEESFAYTFPTLYEPWDVQKVKDAHTEKRINLFNKDVELLNNNFDILLRIAKITGEIYSIINERGNAGLKENPEDIIYVRERIIIISDLRKERSQSINERIHEALYHDIPYRCPELFVKTILTISEYSIEELAEFNVGQIFNVYEQCAKHVGITPLIGIDEGIFCIDKLKDKAYDIQEKFHDALKPL